MSSKIKCTYEECFKHFKSEEAMKKHKEKDPDHFYCKRCDVDCEDDTEFLIHQIVSSKHIACPECGAEFEGTSARDLHVDVRHKKKQVLTCVGCNAKLAGASGYMAHIGKGECEVITLEAFDRLRAERQVQKDHWEEALDSNVPIYGDSLKLASDADTNGGAPLMDEDFRGTTDGHRTTLDLDSRISPLQPTDSTAQQPTSKLASSMANLAVDRYPPLPAQPKGTQNAATKENVPPKPTVDGDLLKFDEAEVRSNVIPKPQQQNPGVWTSTSAASHKLFPPKGEKVYPSQSDLSSFPNESARTTLTGATYGNDTQVRGSNPLINRPSNVQSRRQMPVRHYKQSFKNCPPNNDSPIPGAASPKNNDPNAPHKGVHTAPRVEIQSILNPMDWYDDIRNKFCCPGKDCKRDFDTAEGFKAHFITGTHVGGKTQCPHCLKKFASTWALIAHCESPSRKCKISKTANYNQVLRELTAGLLGTEGHTDDNSDVRYVANPVEKWVEQEEETYW